jgi:2-polyprenyl-6-methoxyphenol hydroxylase-like FAD-dependent oxidoreductase
MMSSREVAMRILIVGGGIGGLATALTLHARGIDCAVYEQSAAIRELGVGVNILPHAIKVLIELGSSKSSTQSRSALVS